jgi:transposase
LHIIYYTIEHEHCQVFAFIHSYHSGSQHVDFGFANNSPMNKRKFKVGLNVAADGNVLTDYELWPGRMADMATVKENMDRLRHLLQRQGWPLQEAMIIGDQANVDDKLALAYDGRNLRYLAGQGSVA